MNTMELKNALFDGHTLDELFPFEDGDGCMVYKNHYWDGSETEEIVYIPDLDVQCGGYVPFDEQLDADTIDDVLSAIWTGSQFVATCEGDEAIARLIFDTCWWCNPCTAWLDYLACSEPEDLAREADIPIEKARKVFKAYA